MAMSETKPKISVLVPIYNVERYLKQCLASLSVQTFRDFEVVCINDGSTDGSLSIIEEFMAADPRFRVINKYNSGYGASMNRGIAEARGDYIAILESDDFFIPTALELLYDAACEHDVEVAKANYWFHWSKPAVRDVPIKVIDVEMADHVLDPQEEPAIYLAIPSIWSALYRRSFLQDNDITFLETPGASFQDMGFNFKVWAFARRVYLIQDEILHYRQDNEASSVNDQSKVFCVCTEFEEIERIQADLPNATELAPIVFRMKYDSYLWNYQRLSKPLRKKFLNRMVEELAQGVAAGDYDPALFGSWQRRNLDLLLADPIRFMEIFPENPTKVARAWYYFKLGGPKAILDIVRR